MKSKIIFPLFLFLVACSTPRLKVQSNPPNAQVFGAQQSAKDRKLIGTTPLEITYKDMHEKLGSNAATGEYLVLTLEANGHEPERLLIPPLAVGTTEVTVRAQLVAKTDVKNASGILARLHNAQKFAQAGQLERAQIECDKALEIDPNFVRSLSMKGSLFYLQKKYDDAIKWFEKALVVDNTFDEAVKMISRIKQERTKQ